jgi:hypothetical protein
MMQNSRDMIKHSINATGQRTVHDTDRSMAAPVPRRNRLTPEGEIVADPARGLLMGNRGRLHRADGTSRAALWTTKAWIACVLSFRGRRREIMAPGSYTELFFLDEATAYAAGHRPCAECRRADYLAFRTLWEEAFGACRAPEIDAALHAARVGRDRSKVVFPASADDLPDGTMIRTGGGPAVLLGGSAMPWAPGGYGAPCPRPRGTVAVLTPAPVVTLFREGLVPALHPTAGRAG